MPLFICFKGNTKYWDEVKDINHTLKIQIQGISNVSIVLCIENVHASTLIFCGEKEVHKALTILFRCT
jgi:hypothetical protein